MVDDPINLHLWGLAGCTRRHVEWVRNTTVPPAFHGHQAARFPAIAAGASAGRPP